MCKPITSKMFTTLTRTVQPQNVKLEHKEALWHGVSHGENLCMNNAHACYLQETGKVVDRMYDHPREGVLDLRNRAVSEKIP